MKRIIILCIVVLVCLAPVAVSPQSSANYKLIGGDLNAGGSASMASTSYTASVTLGQSSPIGVSNSASYQAQMGVQYVYQQTAPEPQFFLLWTK